MSDKARAVKEHTLAIEAKHAAMTGGTFRDAETANIRNLERLSARQRERKPIAPRRSQRELSKSEVKASGVTRKVAAPKKLVAPPCRFCGVCLHCKRLQRSQLIMRKGREGDPAMLKLATELVGLALAAQGRSDYRDAIGREYPFSRIKGPTADRAMTAGVEAICDRSVPVLGGWR